MKAKLSSTHGKAKNLTKDYPYTEDELSINYKAEGNKMASCRFWEENWTWSCCTSMYM